jgi:hypothetical protein
MGADEDVTTHLLLSSDSFDRDDFDVCGDQEDEDMMVDSSSMSIISSTYHYVSEDLKRETGIKSEHDETGNINESLGDIEIAN